jgi:glucose-6-phosphate 1-epimerase
MNDFSTVTIPLLTLTHGNSRCVLSLFGAHVLSYQHNGQEKLFVSKAAHLDGSRPIRGGIPVCWPWFGQLHSDIAQHKQAHGLVRNQLWQIDAQVKTEQASSITLSPTVTSSPLWPEGLSAQLVVTLTAESLSVALHSHNNSVEDISLSGALHSYLAVPDVTNIELIGLSGPYHNNANNGALGQTPSPYTFTGEVDRIHPTNVAQTKIEQASYVVTSVFHQGHDSLVIWNPWIEKSSALADMENTEYLSMVCIETALTQGFSLPAGQTHVLEQTIT